MRIPELTHQIGVFDHITSVQDPSNRVAGGNALPSPDRGVEEKVVARLQRFEFSSPLIDIPVGELLE
jgi:hypothetical protein